MIKYPSTGQFRNVVKSVKETADYHAVEYPTLIFTGTVKLHGTNASISCSNGVLTPQSKKCELSLAKDNAGFAAFAGRKEVVELIRTLDFQLLNRGIIDTFTVFGEWCGPGIQKGVGINKIEEKIWVVFGIKVTPTSGSSYWIDVPDLVDTPRVYDIRDFGVFSIDIDFNNPGVTQNVLIALTEEVERECPVAKALGVSGVGEGIVWTHLSVGERYCFKVKGDKHSSSKVKKLAEVDVEKLNSIAEFVDYAVTENRLQQMADEVIFGDFDRKNLGKFIKAVSTDVIKEESDTLVAADLCMRDVGGMLSKKARTWFFKQEEEV